MISLFTSAVRNVPTLLFLPSELFTTQNAKEWKFFTVDPHVGSYISLVLVGVIAVITFNRLRVVGLQVGIKFRFPFKTLATFGLEANISLYR